MAAQFSPTLPWTVEDMTTVAMKTVDGERYIHAAQLAAAFLNLEDSVVQEYGDGPVPVGAVTRMLRLLAEQVTEVERIA